MMAGITLIATGVMLVVVTAVSLANGASRSFISVVIARRRL